VRGWREEVGIRPKVILPVRVAADGYAEVAPLVARMARLRLEPDGASPAPAVAAVAVAGGSIEVLAGEGVDLRTHDDRQSKRRAALEAEIARAAGKLANPGFVANAPSAVVAAQRDRIAELEAELATL
jgi:valyl-tRNA synthetase